jgi:formate hydrogenlyase subunit 6/NADH:ubiquinone oxidoreductase subunit I
MVACQTCANLCPVGAISFVKAPQTTREKAQKIVKDFQVIPKVKKELEERKEELKYK